jgi:hypothetical protein
LPPPRLSVRGGRELPPLGENPPVTFFLLFLFRRRVLRRHWGKKSLLLAQPEFLVPLLQALPPPDPPLLLAHHPLLPLPLSRARTLGLGAWAGRTAQRSQLPYAGESEMSEPRERVTEE